MPSPALERLIRRIADRGLKLNPPIPWPELEAFERKHDIILPPEYREFLLEAGNGGECLNADGIAPLGTVPVSMNEWERDIWSKLEHIREPFPFTEIWEWEPEDWERDDFEVKEFNRITFGNLALGGDHWNIQYHLIVTGEARGTVWVFHEEGVYPLKGRPNFYEWFELMLDGRPIEF